MVEGPQIRELVARAQSGDRAAFDELATSLEESLLARIRGRLGPQLRGRLEPEDVLQETLLRAVSGISKFEWQGEPSVLRWMEGIAVHFILHSARQLGVRRHLHIEREPSGGGVSPSHGQRREERFDRLQNSVDKLPPEYKTVVRLSRIEGLKIHEVAQRMGRTPSSVRNLLFRAMQQLRASFGDTESLHLPDRRLRGQEADDEH